MRVVTNQAGAVVSRHDLMPFGEEWQPATLGREALLFTGQERDYYTGLDYFGARYYRADTRARFTTVDPKPRGRDVGRTSELERIRVRPQQPSTLGRSGWACLD